jgi:hypothetical protein
MISSVSGALNAVISPRRICSVMQVVWGQTHLSIFGLYCRVSTAGCSVCSRNLGVKLKTEIELPCATSEVQLWGRYALALGWYSKLQQRSLCLHRSERFGDRRCDQRVGNGRMQIACRGSRGEV